jgi:hypothetical protein
LSALFALFSRRPHAYSLQDLALVQRLAGYAAVGVAHQRLAEAARHAAVERERTASIESSVELLRTISGVLDIRTVFPQVSEIANKQMARQRVEPKRSRRTADRPSIERRRSVIPVAR